MKKYSILAIFSFLLAQANASTIGVNSIGVNLGSFEFGVDASVNGTNADISKSAFAYEISGNFNLISPKEEKSFGIDVLMRYLGSNELSLGDVDADITMIEGGVRPYLSLSGFTLFADAGFSYIKVEGTETSTGLSGSESETSFAPGVGVQINFEKLNVRPALHWVTYGDDEFDSELDLNDFVRLTIPVSYNFSDKIDISFKYGHAFGTTFYYTDGANSISVEPYLNEYFIGLDYKF
jgi:opacity protein-like surface antigen